MERLVTSEKFFVTIGMLKGNILFMICLNDNGVIYKTDGNICFVRKNVELRK